MGRIDLGAFTSAALVALGAGAMAMSVAGCATTELAGAIMNWLERKGL